MARANVYWQDRSFGDIGVTGETRRDLLAALLPSLALGKVSRIEGNFLRVEGKRRSYKIHLGSGNILMEPNDQYLCIVPAPGAAFEEKPALPFDGDDLLSIVLSKAALLAADDKITDPTILSQIGRWSCESEQDRPNSKFPSATALRIFRCLHSTRRAAIERAAAVLIAGPFEETHVHYKRLAMFVRFVLPDQVFYEDKFYEHVRLNCPGAVPELRKLVQRHADYGDVELRTGASYAAFALGWLDVSQDRGRNNLARDEAAPPVVRLGSRFLCRLSPCRRGRAWGSRGPARTDLRPA